MLKMPLFLSNSCHFSVHKTEISKFLARIHMKYFFLYFSAFRGTVLRAWHRASFARSRPRRAQRTTSWGCVSVGGHTVTEWELLYIARSGFIFISSLSLGTICLLSWYINKALYIHIIKKDLEERKNPWNGIVLKGTVQFKVKSVSIVHLEFHSTFNILVK